MIMITQQEEEINKEILKFMNKYKKKLQDKAPYACDPNKEILNITLNRILNEVVLYPFYNN